MATAAEIKASIDANITDKIVSQSIDNIDVGTDLKSIVDYTDQEITTVTSSLATVATTGSYIDLEDTPILGTVALTNDYNDLDNLPSDTDNYTGKYKIIITQSSTSDPVVNNILFNTIGNIVWTRISIGLYYGTLTGAFTNQKTFLSISPLASVLYEIYQNDANTIVIKTLDISTLTFMDGGLNKTSILIEVYP
jgi:hypothetical protein